MSAIRSLYDVESIFLEKFSHKYKFTERDLRRAFNNFDVDGSGLLDLSELQIAMERFFLQGVKEEQIKALIDCYDVNGDGKISYEEFSTFLMNRGAVTNGVNRKKEKVERNPKPYAKHFEGDDREMVYPKKAQKAWEVTPKEVTVHPKVFAEEEMEFDPPGSEILSDFDPSNPNDVEGRAKIFLHGLKAVLIKKATDLRAQRKVKDSLTMSKTEFIETVCLSILLKVSQHNARFVLDCIFCYDSSPILHANRHFRNLRAPGMEERG